ncbi:hypothetical protein GCM10022214_64060 [Actinomadura miaoliensis]|uniref:Uncharacterized protein n=1 Tax=Actinomadura miaoliensis TaxID=430685 RepID=A0ABP7WPB1_9ACTN
MASALGAPMVGREVSPYSGGSSWAVSPRSRRKSSITPIAHLALPLAAVRLPDHLDTRIVIKSLQYVIMGPPCAQLPESEPG